MAKCSFCKKSISKGVGKILIQNTGRVLNFCSRKCEKNIFKLKRNPAKFKWSSKAKEIV